LLLFAAGVAGYFAFRRAAFAGSYGEPKGEIVKNPEDLVSQPNLGI